MKLNGREYVMISKPRTLIATNLNGVTVWGRGDYHTNGEEGIITVRRNCPLIRGRPLIGVSFVDGFYCILKQGDQVLEFFSMARVRL